MYLDEIRFTQLFCSYFTSPRSINSVKYPTYHLYSKQKLKIHYVINIIKKESNLQFAHNGNEIQVLPVKMTIQRECQQCPKKINSFTSAIQ